MVSMRLMSLVLVFVIAASAGAADAGSGDWPHYGHFAARQSVAVDGPNTIDANTLEWVADADPQDPCYYVEFESATGAVVYNGKVYAYAKYYNELGEYTDSQIIAYDANSGQILWATVIDKAIYGSWSTPCVDTKHNTVLIGSGYKVFAIDAQSGTQKWATQLDKFVVNASVCTALDIAYARAFITDYDGFDPTGKLYCINLDPNEPNNPYEPGDVVWSDVLGATSGNSAAYKGGVVYAASISGTDSSHGTIHAYDATVEANAVKLWETTDPNFDGFSGGVTVSKEGFLYAANYDWADANEDNSALCKLDCNDGSIVWITQTERTNSMPVVVGDKIYICGGYDGWGSRPKVQAYHDYGDTVTKLWETDPNNIAAVGGWSNQPVYANGKLYVGAIPLGGDYFGTYTDLYILDAALTLDDPNFIIAHYDANECGNSPAVTYDSIYTIGYDGLFKFHQPAFLGDISKNNKVDTYDLAELVNVWLCDGPIGVRRSDLDLDGDVDFIDFSLLTKECGRELE